MIRTINTVHITAEQNMEQSDRWHCKIVIHILYAQYIYTTAVPENIEAKRATVCSNGLSQEFVIELSDTAVRHIKRTFLFMTLLKWYEYKYITLIEEFAQRKK